MKITLDEHGIAMPDNNIKGFVNNKLAKCADIHTSQMLVVDCIRSHFAKNPPTFPVQWEFYGREVHFDTCVPLMLGSIPVLTLRVNSLVILFV